MTRIWTAIIATVTTGFVSSFLIPAAAWAEHSGVADSLRRGPRIGFGLAGVVCCLVVVAGIIAVVVLITRRRR
jgi:nitrate reductase gamma subunit